MTHQIDACVREGSELACVEGCKYPDRTRVVASCAAHVSPQGITRQTVVQAWDSLTQNFRPNEKVGAAAMLLSFVSWAGVLNSAAYRHPDEMFRPGRRF